jgi:hypothetical protein
MREEELSEIGEVSFEYLATLLYQGVERVLEDVILVEAGFIVAGVFTLYA